MALASGSGILCGVPCTPDLRLWQACVDTSSFAAALTGLLPLDESHYNLLQVGPFIGGAAGAMIYDLLFRDFYVIDEDGNKVHVSQFLALPVHLPEHELFSSLLSICTMMHLQDPTTDCTAILTAADVLCSIEYSL